MPFEIDPKKVGIRTRFDPAEPDRRTRRDPRKAEDWFPPEIVAAARAGHAKYIQDLPNFVKWDDLPIQSQDDWILIWNAMHKAYKQAGGK